MPEKGKTFAGEVREETVAWSKDTYQLLKQAEQGKVKSYVQDIALAVLDCKETATSRETFIRLMNERGYGVDWQDSHKYITYTDLAREQAGEKACKIRDNKLEKYYNMDFGKESMEHEFERNARTAEAEQSKRAASRVKPTEPDRAGKQSAQRSVGDVERELRGIDEAVKSRTTPRFKVVVLFATPPFWFTTEITLHILFSSIYFSQFSFCQIFNNAIISRFIIAGVYLLGKYL